MLLTLGYPLILAVTFLTDLEFYADQFFPFDLSNNKNIVKINYLLKLEESFDQIVKTKEFKLLYCYIGDYETTCIEKDCYLKQFLNLPLKKENFENLKLLLLYHVESIYKKEIFKNPKDIKLRIAYVLFLFEKLNRKIKAKNELIFLTKFELNLEYSFLIYKLKKYFENNMNKELNTNEINSKNFTNKLNSQEIKTLIEDLLEKYMSFFNNMLIHEFKSFNNLIKLSHLGAKIILLNQELNNKIKSLDNWNILDQDSINIYTQYLKEIIKKQLNSKIKF